MSKLEDADDALQQGVRFASHNEEIEPDETMTGAEGKPRQDLGPDAKEEMRALASSLQSQNQRLQSDRLENFSFEPVSLPASRAPSPSSTGQRTPMPYSATASPRPSPPASTMHSPPLTPAATHSRESHSRDSKPGTAGGASSRASSLMTPEVSPPHDTAPTSTSTTEDDRKKSTDRQHRAKPEAAGTPAHPKEPPRFTIGPSGDSLPGSEGVSPSPSPNSASGASAPGTPATPQSPAMRPAMSPRGDSEDPYASSKRPAFTTRSSLDPRFLFGGRDPRGHASASSSTTSLPRSRGGEKDGKRHTFFGGHHHKKHEGENNKDGVHQLEKKHGSMTELKRFFKLGAHKNKDKSRPTSPSGSFRKSGSKSGTTTPVSRPSSVAIPFADDHGLEAKYGKFGKVLGSGAGGSVRIIKRSSDGTVFAVKQFRARHSYESDKEYTKKLTGEFCIGSTLHHGNIIETMDLVHEKGNWFVVMEYAPYDLFAIVMTGKMSREEVTCSTMQILSGVVYLHSMGLAHRDLKLDNVVVNEHGIMKIIDFGSAAVFRYPFENDVVLASGIVGSDPYLAPEVYDLQKYDPQPTDIWSIAIIFCCMTLRRFPWKAPRVSDNSYKLFVSPPNTGDWPQHTQPRRSGEVGGVSKSVIDLKEHEKTGAKRGVESEPASRVNSQVDPKDTGSKHENQENGHSTKPNGHEQDRPHSNHEHKSSRDSAASPQAQQTIKGPWRLLRLLPRESRHIIGRMLEIDPKKRATMEEILEDKWVKTAPKCQQVEGGKVLKAEGHTHTLEPGNAQTAAATGNSSRK
ncbi:uncharacterized protein K452DRAFT_159640 [Aplosporella prunicola CBS 121167]|uniref:non-specific serine/threonine protein kinase n=1 Tax=Aplosporella prunicola CBS 121167 TaxID=1176127 RepID=A0A6A6BHH2_9PEZI|nr:uncharacterized protein K452DRAFT_159640 [Aplosporella prunicola CBS 121167]KAF2143590.1 hypothetical protein K452DRAFT_159640 [Aplosporella prunicola CBS 121167]